MCIYAINVVEERASFFSNLFQYISRDKCLILLGDFNCVLEARDRSNNAGIRDKSSHILSKLISDSELDDVCECLEGEREVMYTRFQGNSHARLDRLYMSQDMIPMCHNYSVAPVSFSDHCLVKCHIGMEKEASFNWDLWKMNALLLKDVPFVEAIHGAVMEVCDESTETIAEKWEWFKQKVQMKAIERSSCLKFEREMKERDLRKILKQLVALDCKGPGAYKQDVRTIKEKKLSS